MTCARLISYLVVPGALALASCTTNPHFTINAPANGASVVCTDAAGVNCAVPVEVQWDGVSVRPHPEATLDGVALTASFSTSGNSSVDTISTGLGVHTLGVSGDLQGKSGTATYSATSTFTVTAKPPVTPPAGGFSLNPNPSGVVVERGKSATTTITVTRSPPFAGAVTVAASTPPPGITVPNVTLGAGATSGVVTVNASSAAAIGKVTLNLTGTSGTVSVVTSVAVTIGRETGAFQEASPKPTLSSLPSSVNAVSGTFRVDIAVGPPTVPQPRKARFFRGTQVVDEIGFTLGPASTIGGAGFCNNSSGAAITRGVVLSGQMPAFASQNVVTFLDVTVNSPPLFQVPTDMDVQQTSGGALVLFQPRVFFSRDCTLALVAGASKLGPSKHVLRVYNLITGQPIGPDVPFDTNIFGALVRTAAGKQEVEVKVDTGASSAQTVVIAIP